MPDVDMSTSHIKQVAFAALARFDDVMLWLGLTGGKNRGREYLPLNPKRGDHKPGSFTINRDTGKWMDGATGDKGGDLVALGAYLWGIKQGEAAARLRETLNMPQIASDTRARSGKYRAKPGGDRLSANVPKASHNMLQCVMPIPNDAPEPPSAHPRYGHPSRAWAYRGSDGRVNFYHWRFDLKTEGLRKQFSPLTLWRDNAGRYSWQWKAAPSPRPVFGLDALLARPRDPVCIVEGEKAADAAQQLLPGYVVITWQGGALAVGKADWQSLRGRTVILWPDADTPGLTAMQTLAEALQGVVASVQQVNLARFETRPGTTDRIALLICV